MNETALEAAAQAMCDRVNGQGDYAENIGQRRTGWLAQARAGVSAYLAALATPKPPVDEAMTIDQYAYDELWDAIAAATRIEAGMVSISVVKFREAIRNLTGDGAGA